MMGASICFGIAALSACLSIFVKKWMTARVARLKKDAPPAFKFSLPSFAGRILPGYQIKPGTFTIATDFSEISRWEDDAIMSYDAYKEEFVKACRLMLKAWVPDGKTPGVFNLAVKKIDLPSSWNKDYKPDMIELRDNEIIVTPRVEDEDAGFGWLILLFLMGLSSVTIGIVFVTAFVLEKVF
jgi:hypothetical protein